jgi:DNA-binding transcriptional regulator GbsR (MarR family)
MTDDDCMASSAAAETANRPHSSAQNCLAAAAPPDISNHREPNEMKSLTPVATRFILHWGEMGTRWGINRTMGQIHALLFISEKPLPAEEICEVLGVARSNVSNSLRELQNWRIVRLVHLAGDRRDHFESVKDVFEMFRLIAAERKRREIDPTVATLRECIGQADRKNSADAYTIKRLEDLAEFFENGAAWFDKMGRIPAKRLQKAMKLGEKVFSLLGIGE